LSAKGVGIRQARLSGRLLVEIAAVFLAYFIAGKLGQATTNIRSSNLGPVWPAYGIALAAFLSYGYRVWPGIAASAFLVAFQGSVPPIAAAGQATGATIAALTGTFLLRRIPDFDPSLSRLRDALGLVVLGAFGSAILSASIGVFSLYTTHVQAYSGLASAWLIYWLGDSTGVLLVTPLVFTLPTLEIRSRADIADCASHAAHGRCFIISRLHLIRFSCMSWPLRFSVRHVGGHRPAWAARSRSS
jgi:integral membrane sensor domain MASE1